MARHIASLNGRKMLHVSAGEGLEAAKLSKATPEKTFELDISSEGAG